MRPENCGEKAYQADEYTRHDFPLTLIDSLEALSIPVTVDRSKLMRDFRLGNLSAYSMHFGQIDLREVLEVLHDRFPGEPIITADIGGFCGTAAAELEALGALRCFVIDPKDTRTSFDVPLPHNRFIQRFAEDLHDIANNSFHLCLSCNALSYSDNLSGAMNEIIRVLRPGGIGLLELEFWRFSPTTDVLRLLVNRSDITVHHVYVETGSSSPQMISLDEALNSISAPTLDPGTKLNFLVSNGFKLQKHY